MPSFPYAVFSRYFFVLLSRWPLLMMDADVDGGTGEKIFDDPSFVGPRKMQYSTRYSKNSDSQYISFSET
jgi:hypothetical protein